MNPRKDLSPELAELWQRLDGARGRKYWRSLEELADSDAFRELVRREFPEQPTEPGGLNRRQFLTLMGASLALAGLSGCAVQPAPPETLVPYVRAPEELVPGKPLFFATAMTMGGAGVGLLVESHMGRPTKVEGNPEHPASLGATSVFHQASVLTLYDPDRSQTVRHLGQTTTWDDFLTTLRPELERLKKRGAGLRVLTETVVSPTLHGQIEALLKKFDGAKWHQYEPLARDAAHRAGVTAFGQPLNSYPRFYDLKRKENKADVIVSLDADFLGGGPSQLRSVAEFVAGRRVRSGEPKQARMSRLYCVETNLSLTGAKADHRLALRPRQVETFARALAAELKVPGVRAAGELPKEADDWMRHVAADLRYGDPENGGKRERPRRPGSTLVLAGDRQPPAVHLLAHAINRELGNVGQTVLYTDPVAPRPVDHARSLRELVDDMNAGGVEVLLILGGNPVFTAPADLRFADAMNNVRLRIHLSLFHDETSRLCHWHLPEAHYLEAWSDTRAFDGTASIVQPLIAPLYEGRSAHEVVSLFTGQLRAPGYDTVRAYWREQWQGRGASAGDFEDFWQTAVHDGVVADTAFSPKSADSLKWQDGWEKHLDSGAGDGGEGTYDLVLEPDPTIYDGRFANNGWLQELPKPITRLTWDNAALMSPTTARKLDLGGALGAYAHGGEHGGYHQPVVELALGDRRVRAPVWLVPGHADDCVTVHLGYGRESSGKVGGNGDNPVGFNAYRLRTSDHPWFAPGLTVTKTNETYVLACTQQHQLMENREPVRSATLTEFRDKPDFATAKEKHHLEREHAKIGTPPEHRRKPLTLYDRHPSDGNQWGMAIDLTACVGCGACVVACQAENNIPVVGKDQVTRGREMHWIRIDRYNSGPFAGPTEFHFQPVPCMHCEDAPCEYVCPVEATVHSADGLNDMLYQRCVGTRFCSNNCPYKVRRFNFLRFADFDTPSLRLQFNPDVTVRSRGVMEKCTYCVQRIRHAQIDAEREGRDIFDGEILTACQAACPAGAIVFGDINDKKSRVRRWKDTPLNYELLGEVNTRPRTTYLAEVRNPNPAMAGGAGKEGD